MLPDKGSNTISLSSSIPTELRRRIVQAPLYAPLVIVCPSEIITSVPTSFQISLRVSKPTTPLSTSPLIMFVVKSKVPGKYARYVTLLKYAELSSSFVSNMVFKNSTDQSENCSLVVDERSTRLVVPHNSILSNVNSLIQTLPSLFPRTSSSEEFSMATPSKFLSTSVSMADVYSV